MKKRVRITALITTLCLCLSLFVVGVLAATSATFNVTSTLNFKSTGAYVKLNAELRQGETVENSILQTDAPDSYTYTGYSYSRIGSGANPDLPDGSKSLDSFVDENNQPASMWTIGDINFSESLPIAVYHFTFTNYSENMLIATITINNLETLNTELAGKVKINSGSGSASIAGYDGVTPSTATYDISVEIENFTSNINNVDLSVTIEFETAEVNYDYFNYSTDNTQITGLSNYYNSLETKPETLIIPSKAQDGTNVTSIMKIGPTLESTNVIIQEGIINLTTNFLMNSLTVEKVVLPNTIVTIGNYCFSFCDSLINIVIPSSVKTIGDNSFSACNSLETLYIENGLENIGNNSFTNLPILNLDIPNSVRVIGESSFSGNFYLETLTIANGVTTIGESAFIFLGQINESLEKIVIPNSVTSIGEGAFENSYAFTLELEEGNQNYVMENGVLYDKNKTTVLWVDRSITEVNLPQTLTKIGNSAFSYCNIRNNPAIPSNVTTIGNHAFDHCEHFTTLTFEENSKLTTIGDYAFYETWGLRNVVIPESVLTIGNDAFNNRFMETITLYSVSPPSLSGEIFYDFENGAGGHPIRNIYVPAEAVDAYKAASGWSDYADLISAIQ